MVPIIIPYRLFYGTVVFEEMNVPGAGRASLLSQPSHWEFQMPEIKQYLEDHQLQGIVHLAINADNRMTLMFPDEASAALFKLKML